MPSLQVEKHLKDIHGPALALVLERLRPYGPLQGVLFGNYGDLCPVFVSLCLILMEVSHGSIRLI